MVLATGAGVISMAGTDTFLTTMITPTMVTTSNFFVGFIITHVAGQYPAAFDETSPLSNRSFIVAGANINDLSGAIPIEQAGLFGNWLIRADATSGSGVPDSGTTVLLLGCALIVLGLVSRGRVAATVKR